MLAALKLRQIRNSSRLAEQENEAFREAEALALPRAAGDGVYIVVPYLLGLVVDAGAPQGADIALAGVAGVIGAVAVFVALPSRDEEKTG